MKQPERTFEAKPAKREQVPLLIGLTGCSGSGKTYSALRLAKGIQSVVGGKIYFIDTEARRALHYADSFDFQHMEFKPPFGSLDYLTAMQWCVGQGAKIVIVDQCSSEHEGPGGMIEFQEREYERLGSREQTKMLAWVKPKQARRALINGFLQLNANFIFCFRAKSITKPTKINGKTEMVPQGFEPIAGTEWIYELTMNCLLMPKSDGVPTWASEYPGEKMAMKLPSQFRQLFADPKPLSEDIGKQLALWSQGGAAPVDAVKEWKTAIADYQNAHHFNEGMKAHGTFGSDSGRLVWKEFQAGAAKLGLQWNKETKRWNDAPDAPPDVPAQSFDHRGDDGNGELLAGSEQVRRIESLAGEMQLQASVFRGILMATGAKSLTRATVQQAEQILASLEEMAREGAHTE